MWKYVQSTGELFHDGNHVSFGYSGAMPDGKNNPATQAVHNVGPLCCGWYTIGKAFDSPKRGPLTMHLTPDVTNEMYGRADFEMHGDSVSHPGYASEGCIIEARTVREMVAALVNQGDDRLQVVAYPTD